MRILITGGDGQVGWELKRTAPRDCEVFALSSSELDIRNKKKIKEIIGSLMPDLVINAAAYTAVDKAETESDKAYSINAEGAGNLAEVAYINDSRFIHISTDFVFDGSQSHPYVPADQACPLNVYGASKFEGEKLVLEKTDGMALILRTSWVYSAHGNNFVNKMLQLLQYKEELSIVDDQIGTPTWAFELAKAIWKLQRETTANGILHWTDAGVASWYDFAVAIQEEALRNRLITKKTKIKPIPSVNYTRLAKIPSYSVLDKHDTWECLGLEASHWRKSLQLMLLEVKPLI